MTALSFANLPQHSISLSDFGALLERYKPLAPAARAAAMLEDATPALQLAEGVLQQLHDNALANKALGTLRGSLPLLGKLRGSEAKVQLLDSSCDFIQSTQHKLAVWRKSMERLAGGEGVMAGKPFISANEPLAVTLMKPSGISGYLSIMQLVLGEMGRTDEVHASQYAKITAQLRRCSTVISDCESAADITALIR